MNPPQLKIISGNEFSDEIGIITGTRPGIIMMAPVVRELKKRGYPFFVIHSAQHYSPNMDANIFSDLEIPEPDYRLVGTKEHKTHGAQTGFMLAEIEKVLLERKPRTMLIYGDTNSNLAAALAARKLRINVAHIEAGERCFDWNKPEEHNRKLIDVISDYLLVTGEKAKKHLLNEGVDASRIFITGNPIVDIAIQEAERAQKQSNATEEMGLTPNTYALMTMHREENTDSKEKLQSALEGVSQATQAIGLKETVFLAHPRTTNRLEQFGLSEWASTLPGLRIAEPASYLDFIKLLSDAKFVFTDSGGVSQETVIHRIPAVVMLEKTEWVEGVDLGAHILTGCHKDKIVEAAKQLQDRKGSDWGWPFGTPDSSQKICDLLINDVAEKRVVNG
ncbi:MAG: non-hydrolyzing UDP-N-acetylglucosamine 2-epimerase [Rickettsiales bacterium]